MAEPLACTVEALQGRMRLLMWEKHLKTFSGNIGTAARLAQPYKPYSFLEATDMDCHCVYNAAYESTR